MAFIVLGMSHLEPNRKMAELFRGTKIVISGLKSTHFSRVLEAEPGCTG